MFEAQSWVAPLYQGTFHWSKPPLHFWSAMVAFFTTGSASLFLSRAVVALYGICACGVWSWWCKRYLKISFPVSFIVFAASFGLIKFSRTFMMEIPLAVYPSIACLLWFHARELRSQRWMFVAAFLLGASCLVKGPISLVMGYACILIFTGMDFFLAKRPVKRELKSLFLFFAISLATASIWFILATFAEGWKFLDYFFLRENVGKFTSQRYPVRVLFEGLLLYALPWSLFLSSLFVSLSTKKIFKNRDGRPVIFLIVALACFFLPWLIPNQRSHHYAIPAIPFFLMLLAWSIDRAPKNPRSFAVGKILTGILILIFVLILALAGRLDPNHYLVIVLCLCPLVLALILIFKKGFLPWAIPFSIGFLLLWDVLLPVFYLPIVPANVIPLIGPSVSAVSRRPYFLEEALGTKVEAIEQEQVADRLANNRQIILNNEAFLQSGAQSKAAILYRWPHWKRRVSLQDIRAAISSGSLIPVQEEMLLISVLRAE
jgi:4-amino-4-deoxy-L-arabinose transferase-like glycosyltransferase